MKITSAEWEQAIARLETICPTPWYLERDNVEGIEIRDCNGHTVFAVEYCFPDEFTSCQRELEIERTRALAHYLMAAFGRADVPVSHYNTNQH